MRREERVTVQGPVKEQQPDGMSHRGDPPPPGPGTSPPQSDWAEFFSRPSANQNFLQSLQKVSTSGGGGEGGLDPPTHPSPLDPPPPEGALIVRIILSHMCWGTPPPTSPVGPSGVPVTGALKGSGGMGGLEKGLE